MENINESPAVCKPKITALAQLVALYAECRGVTSTAELVAATGYTERAIRKAKAELGCRNQGAAGTRVPEPQCRPGTPAPLTRNPGAVSEPRCRNQGADSASRTHAHIELPSEVVISKEVNKEKGLSKDNPKKPKREKPSFGRQQALEAFEAYNAVALRCGIPQASRMTPDRERKIIARLKDHGVDGWAQALAHIEQSKFLTGGNDRGWRASLDFMLQASSFAKCVDGGYGNGRHVPNKSNIDLPPVETDEQMKARFAKMVSDAVAGCAT